MIPPRAILLALVAFISPPASTQDSTATDVDRLIDQIESEFAARFDQSVNRPFNEKLVELDLNYFQALDRALDSAANAARLEEALALREEKERFTRETNVPESDETGILPPLAQLRNTYRAERQKLEAIRDQISAPLLAGHDAKLEAHQTLLTREGKLEEALKVKNAREMAAAKVAAPSANDPSIASLKTTSEVTSAWHEIFDGADLKNWKPTESSRNFRLVDGILAARRETDEPDHLIFQGTDKVPAVLRNFELKATIKADPVANSGIYFHIDERITGRGGFPDDGIEVSLFNGPDPARYRYPTGTLHSAATEAPAKIDQTQWFELHFKVQDRTVTVTLNGKPYLEHLAVIATKESPKGISEEGGRLAIQANSKEGAFYFQNIAVKVSD